MKKTGDLPKLIAVLHLPPLPGSPGAAQMSGAEALSRAGEVAIREAEILTRAGFDGLMLENFGDTPFFSEAVPSETIAAMAVIAAAVREVSRLPLGINVLRNDARAALGIAAAIGADYIRVNILNGVAATDQGFIQGHAAELLRERDRIAPGVAILADAHVKHAKTLSSDDIALAVEELALRARADGVIITGATTGRAPSQEDLEVALRAARHAGDAPLFVGSGATLETVGELVRSGFRIIVGSAVRKGGRAGTPVDQAAAKAFVRAALTKKGAKSQASSKKNTRIKRRR